MVAVGGSTAGIEAEQLSLVTGWLESYAPATLEALGEALGVGPALAECHRRLVAEVKAWELGLQGHFAAPPDPVGYEAPAGGGFPLRLLPPPTRANAHKAGGDCLAGSVFQVVCGDGNWKWTWAPCGKWGCQPCRERRIAEDLVPEVLANMEQARRERLTLKFVTLSWQGDDLGAQPTPEGAKRRGLDRQHLAQWVRRDLGQVFEYLRVPETHRSGKVHEHMLVRMPYIRQKDLSRKWADFARGSFVVDVRAVFAKCPGCWPGPGAPEAVKKLSRITPWPGKGRCENCGYKPHPVELERLMVMGAAWEVGKYLGKAPVGKMTRSKGWQPPEPADDAGAGKLCQGCGDEHRVTYVGPRLEVEASHPVISEALAFKMAYYPPGGSPCRCWGENRVWMESKGSAGQGLGDLVGLARDGPGDDVHQGPGDDVHQGPGVGGVQGASRNPGAVC